MTTLPKFTKREQFEAFEEIALIMIKALNEAIENIKKNIPLMFDETVILKSECFKILYQISADYLKIINEEVKKEFVKSQKS